MSTDRRARLREATRGEIKLVARRLMEEQGISSLSLHAIAREMGLTAPALYRYFPNRNDLVTALIVDGYQAYAKAMRAAVATCPVTDPVGRLFAAVLAYRDWALAHPTDYLLVAGSPVPGYTPPMDIVHASARRGMDLLMRLVSAALPADGYAPPQIEFSPEFEAALDALRRQRGYDLPLPVISVVLAGWAQAQGFVTQELYQHLQPLLADPAELYRYEARVWFQRLGLKAPV